MSEWGKALLPPLSAAFLTILLTIISRFDSPKLLGAYALVVFIVICGVIAYHFPPIGATATDQLTTEDDSTAIERSDKQSSKSQLFLFVIATLLCVCAIVLVVWKQVEVVPNLTLKTFADARADANSRGFDIIATFQAPDSDEYTKTQRQHPPPGTRLVKGATIEVEIGVRDVAIAITEPADGATARMRQVVVGTSKGVAESQGRLFGYLLLHPNDADGFWVYGPLGIDEEGDWSHLVYLGTPNEPPGQDYQLFAVIVSEALKSQGSARGSPEYEAIPPYVAIGKRVTVKRSD